MLHGEQSIHKFLFLQANSYKDSETVSLIIAGLEILLKFLH